LPLSNGEEPGRKTVFSGLFTHIESGEIAAIRIDRGGDLTFFLGGSGVLNWGIVRILDFALTQVLDPYDAQVSIYMNSSESSKSNKDRQFPESMG